MIDVYEMVTLIVISALVGGLIGIEREKKKTVLAGSGTFMLVAMYGTVELSKKATLPTMIVALIDEIALVIQGIL